MSVCIDWMIIGTYSIYINFHPPLKSETNDLNYEHLTSHRLVVRLNTALIDKLILKKSQFELVCQQVQTTAKLILA